MSDFHFILLSRHPPTHVLIVLADHAPSPTKTVFTEHLCAHADGACFRAAVDLVLEDDRINTVPALHATEDLGVVFAGVTQVVAPVVHEQAGAPSAGSRRELLTRREEPHSLSIPVLGHRSNPRRLVRLDSPFHDSASRLLARRDMFLSSERQCVASRCGHCSPVT